MRTEVSTSSLIVFMLLIGFMLIALTMSCHPAWASGDISIILNDTTATSDWSGSEKTNSAWGLSGNYGKSIIIGSYTTLSAGVKAEYSQKKIGGSHVVGKDELRTKLDVARATRKIGINTFVSAKTYTHFDNSDHNIYLKYGTGKTGSIPMVIQGTTKLITVDYDAKLSISQNWQNTTASLGVLFELAGVIRQGNLLFSLDDGDVFFGDKRAFEFPFAIEYVQKPLFIKQSWLIRGNSDNTGCLRTTEAGVRYKF
ncbi:MAG: hypothetical protein KKG91_06125 [Candidatus Omnitrophica bacterium]|nr:hypothetical protein [Candidatus Omnitrophota bacterium]